MTQHAVPAPAPAPAPVTERPVLIVGYVGGSVEAFDGIQPDNTVIFIEEPDIVRKRGVRERLVGAAVVRDLVECEFHLPGRADEFYLAHRALDPAAVVPLTEYATPFAARLAERYGLPGAGFGAAQILRDKALLRRVSAAAGIANPPVAAVTGPADVRDFMARCPGPIVLKPANRQASVGTQVISDPAEVEQAWANCVTQDEGIYVPDRKMELRMLAEGFVAGDEYSVEMLVRAGQPLFVNVTGKELFPGPRPVERCHVVPADIGPELAALLGEQTRAVVDAVGFRNGIVHCEWIVADGVPHLVECAGRFAGDGIIELIQRAYPIELLRAYYAVMKGEELPQELPRVAARAAAVRFLALEAGVVEEVRGVADAAGAEGVVACDVGVSAGDRFAGLRSSWDRAGDIMVTADNPAQALRLAEAAAAMVHIDMRPAEEAVPMATATP